jgi:glycosyltransferase involved in cell wall biosynthesis
MKKQPTAIICLSPYAGGMEIDSIKLAKKLSPFMDIVLVAKENNFIASQKESYLNYNNIKLETISFKSNFGLSIILNTRKIIQKYAIKNVIFFGASELKSLYFAFLGLDINLIIRHGTTKSRPKKDWFHRLIYSHVNYHVSICKHLEKNVNYIIPFGKRTEAKLIYPSFDFSKPKNIPHQKITLLHVGRVADAKGQVDAIKACEILVENNIDFEFNIVGGFDEAYKEKFMLFYNNCPYKEKINLIGFTNNVQSYIYKSDIFLFPSHGEGMSNAFLEALSNNLLCIAYDNTSFPEIRSMNIYFHLIDNKNILKLKKSLLASVVNLKEEKQKAVMNNKLIKNLFSLEQELSSYLKILI